MQQVIYGVPKMTDKLMQYTCAECGSRDLLFDAYAYWHVAAQRFELQEAFPDQKNTVCQNCGYEGRPDYTEWKDDQT